MSKVTSPADGPGLGDRPADAVDFVAPDVTVDAPAPKTPSPTLRTTNLAELAATEPPSFHFVGAAPTAVIAIDLKKTRKDALIRLGVLLLILGVIIAFVVISNHNNKPEPTAPAGPGWSDAYQTGVADSAPSDHTFGDVVMVGGYGSGPLTAFDLDTRKPLYTIQPGDYGSLFGDATGLVTQTDAQLNFYDAKTGALVNQTLLLFYGQLSWAGQGMVLTDEFGIGVFCMRAMSNPGTCLWQARDTFTPENQYIFGDGQWVNTGDGVRDIATGAPASFGGDAGYQVSDTDQAYVYYIGSPGRVFRVHYDVTQGFGSSDNVTFQPWDTTTDQAVSPAVTADSVVADASSPVYVAVNSFIGSGSDNDTTTAYSWATGAQLWQKPTDIMGEDYSRFVGGAYVTSLPGQGKYGIAALTALDANTGATIWQPNYYGDFTGNIGDTVYVTESADALIAYDAASGFAAKWQSALPQLKSSWCIPQIVGQIVFCSDESTGEIYFLNS